MGRMPREFAKEFVKGFELVPAREHAVCGI
jgi:hypothetical protein